MNKIEFIDLLNRNDIGDINLIDALYKSAENIMGENYLGNIFNSNKEHIMKYSLGRNIFALEYFETEQEVEEEMNRAKESFKDLNSTKEYILKQLNDDDFKRVIENSNKNIVVMPISKNKMDIIDYDKYFLIKEFLGDDTIEYLVFQNYSKIEGYIKDKFFTEDYEYSNYVDKPILDGYYNLLKEIKQKVHNNKNILKWKEGDDEEILWEMCSPPMDDDKDIERGNISGDICLSLFQIWDLLQKN